MVTILIYFELHQPIRLNKYRIFDIGNSNNYFNNILNEKNFKNNAIKSYIPLNRLLLKLIRKYPNRFKVNFSISGITIRQMQNFAPELLSSFIELSQTGNIEFLGQTSYHSFSFLYSKSEFIRQIEIHSKLIEDNFGQKPKFFKNVEFLCNEEILEVLENLGFKGIFLDSSQDILELKNPNYIYSKKDSNLAIFSKNNQSQYEIATNSNNGDIINLFFNYDKFIDSKMFETLENFIEKNMNYTNISFITPTDAINIFSKKFQIEKPIILNEYNSKLSLWLSNKMQQDAISKIFKLEKDVKSLKDKILLHDWRILTTSDNFLYMRTDNNQFDNIYQSPYDAYVYYMNVLNDLIFRIKLKQEKMKVQKEILKEPRSKGILSDIKLAVKN